MNHPTYAQLRAWRKADEAAMRRKLALLRDGVRRGYMTLPDGERAYYRIGDDGCLHDLRGGSHVKVYREGDPSDTGGLYPLAALLFDDPA